MNIMFDSLKMRFFARRKKSTGVKHYALLRRGADGETRTHDLILTKDVRYRLCHISNWRRHPELNRG